MTGTCWGSTCEEGKTFALLWPGERAKEEERREMHRKEEREEGDIY